MRSIFIPVSMDRVFHTSNRLLIDENLNRSPSRIHIKAIPHLPVFLALFLLLITALSGCAVNGRRPFVSGYKKPAMVLPERDDKTLPEPYTINGVSYYPLLSGEGFIQEGIASWYGEEFHGRKTANGEIYNMYEKTAAHKTLPFGTYVREENLGNDKEVVVRINDRGPFAKGRVLDLSFAAAREVGLVNPGVARVRVVALSKKVGVVKLGDTYRPLVEAKNFMKGEFTVQVGAFKEEDNAMRLAERLSVIFDHVSITTYVPVDGTVLYRVRVSLSKDLNDTNQIVKELEYLGFSEAFIVAL